jgi:molybdopterin converting factor subunit 1
VKVINVKIRVRLFAAARQLAGSDVVELEIPAGGTVGDLRSRLSDQVPQLAALLSHVTFALDSQYADDKTAVPAGAEIACIPPVSGG